MRVAIDGLLLGQHHSGVERAIEEMVKAMARLHGDAITLICTPAYAARAAELGIRHIEAPGYASDKRGRVIFEQLVMSGWLQKQGFDVLHGPGYILPRNWRGPSIVTVYDMIALDYPHWCTWANTLHYRMRLPASLREATFIVAPGMTTAEAISRHVPEVEGKVRRIPLGIGKQFRPVEDRATLDAVRVRYSLPDMFVLCVGNMEPKKNLEAVVEAFEMIARHVEHGLVLAGPKAWKQSGLLRRIAASPERDRIVLAGEVAEDDLPALYSNAGLLLQWSLYEGVGLPPLEAMACGTAAVVSNGGALPEFAGQAAEVCPLGPASTLAECVIALLDDTGRRAEIVANGQRLAARWTWEQHAQAVTALYEEASGA